MSFKKNTIPPKRLAETISASASGFKLNDILGFDGIALTPTIVGDVVYGSFQDPSGSILELFKIDPATIASTTITFLKRGLQFNEDGTETEVSGNKLLWVQNQTIVNLGTDAPALFNVYIDNFNTQSVGGVKTFTSFPLTPSSAPTADYQVSNKKYVNDQDALLQGNINGKVGLTGDETVAGIKSFSSFPVTPSSAPTLDYQTANKKYVDDTAFAGAPNASTTQKGIVEEATQAEVNAGTAVGGTGARLFVNPSTISILPLGSDASDGNVTISSGVTTLTRDMYYSNLTVNGTGTLKNAGYKIFVKGTCTVDTSGGGGGIQNTGNTGGVGVSGSGGAGGSAPAAGTLPAGNAGGAGGGGTTGVTGSVGVAASNITFALVNSSGAAGGAGGAGGGNAGGAGAAAASVSSVAKVSPRDVVTGILPFWFTSTTAVQLSNISTGGSGGGSAGTNVTGGASAYIGNGGGGGGSSGGYLFLLCRYLVITGIGAINTNGGVGGAGGATSPGGSSDGGGGGGGGGNGGACVVAYYAKSGTGTITSTGGAAGAGGAKTGTGTAGTAGSAGAAGLAIEISLT